MRKGVSENALAIIGEPGSFVAYIESDRCAGISCRRCERACPGQVLDILVFNMD